MARQPLFEAKLVRTDGGKLMLDVALGRLADEIADFRRWGHGVGMAFYVVERAQFQTQGAFSGEPWARLNPRYAERKAKKYPGAPILVATGALRASLTEPPSGAGLKQGTTGKLRSARSGESVIEVSKDSLAIGSSSDHAAPHQVRRAGTGGRARPPIVGPENFILVATNSGAETLREVLERVTRE